MAEARLQKSELAIDVARGEYREQSRVRFDEYARELPRDLADRGLSPGSVRVARKQRTSPSAHGRSPRPSSAA